MLLETDKLFNSFEPENFNTEEKCLAYLAELKWRNGFICRKCGNLHSSIGSKPYSKRCTRCKSIESATAHTIFHHCRLPLITAFKIVYTISCSKNISSRELSRQFGIRQMTCWNQLKKVKDCINKNGQLCLLLYKEDDEFKISKN